MNAAQSMLVNCEPWSEWISTRCFGLRRDTTMCSACSTTSVVCTALICPLLNGPFSILEMATKEEWNGEEAQAGGDHRQSA